MKAFHLAPRDARGNLIRPGSRVRVVGLPDLSAIRNVRSRRTVEAVFRHVKGQCKIVRCFSRYGFAEISFKIRRGRLAGWHAIEIEPNLLLLQKVR
jgi:hypothetical protein